LFSAGATALTSVLLAGAGAADGATRLRSGARAHFLGSTRIAANGTAAPGLHPTGSDVMASVVGLMAILALAFLVVTLIRRRVHSPVVTHAA
jgi:hypothetical protein